MTFSQLNATAAPVVAGPGLSYPHLSDRVDLTILVPLDKPAAVLRHVIDRLCEALYAQCITFELLGITTGQDRSGADALQHLPRSRTVVADPAREDDVWSSCFAASAGRWISFVDCAEGADIDAYGLIEHLHRAKDSTRAA